MFCIPVKKLSANFFHPQKKITLLVVFDLQTFIYYIYRHTARPICGTQFWIGGQITAISEIFWTALVLVIVTVSLKKQAMQIALNMKIEIVQDIKKMWDQSLKK